MATYSDEEKKAFSEKDRRISKLSCLSTAAACHKTEANVEMNILITEAEQLLNWVYQESLTPDDESPGDKSTALSEQSTDVSDISCPKPTLDQQKALDKVLAQTGWNAAQVYARFSKFPVMSNVDVCIQKIKESTNG